MRHPRNTEFTWQQPMPPYQLITPEQANAYRELGGFVLEDAFSDEELSLLLSALDPIEAEVNDRLASVLEISPTLLEPMKLSLALMWFCEASKREPSLSTGFLRNCATI